MNASRASASTLSGCAYSRSIRSRTARSRARSSRRGAAAGRLTRRSCHTPARAGQPSARPRSSAYTAARGRPTRTVRPRGAAPRAPRGREGLPLGYARRACPARRAAALHPSCTFLVGANGAGKSTLLEAIAVAAGLGVQGGGSGFPDGWAWRRAQPRRGAHPRTGRSPPEDRFLPACRIDARVRLSAGRPRRSAGAGPVRRRLAARAVPRRELPLDHQPPLRAERPLPPRRAESALSPQSLLALVARIHDLVAEGCQFIISTHAPILLALPERRIVEVGARGLREVDYDDVEAVQITRLVLTIRRA